MANSGLAPSISTAAVTLVSAIIEAIERSMPPAITTTVWAATAKANGSAAETRPTMPAEP